MDRRRVVLLFALFASILLLPRCIWADSNIRMVRLSFVQGSVLIDNATGQGFKPAVINMPVTTSTRIQTGDDGLAEVEFEDGSTLRLTGDTSVLLQPLLLTSKGKRVSGMTVAKGTVYIHVQNTKHDLFYLKANALELALDKNTHLRVSADNTQVLVAVFAGDLTDATSGFEIKKNQSFRIENAADAITEIAKGIDPFPTDAWDRERDQYYKNPAQYPSLATGSLAFATWPGSYDSCSYGMIWGAYGIFSTTCGYWAPSYFGEYWIPTTTTRSLAGVHPRPRPPVPRPHPLAAGGFPKTVVKLPPIERGQSASLVPGKNSLADWHVPGSAPSSSTASMKPRAVAHPAVSAGARWTPVTQSRMGGGGSAAGSRGGGPRGESGGRAASYGGGGRASASGSSGSVSHASAASSAGASSVSAGHPGK